MFGGLFVYLFQGCLSFFDRTVTASVLCEAVSSSSFRVAYIVQTASKHVPALLKHAGNKSADRFRGWHGYPPSLPLLTCLQRGNYSCGNRPARPGYRQAEHNRG